MTQCAALPEQRAFPEQLPDQRPEQRALPKRRLVPEQAPSHLSGAVTHSLCSLVVPLPAQVESTCILDLMVAGLAISDPQDRASASVCDSADRVHARVYGQVSLRGSTSGTGPPTHTPLATHATHAPLAPNPLSRSPSLLVGVSATDLHTRLPTVFQGCGPWWIPIERSQVVLSVPDSGKTEDPIWRDRRTQVVVIPCHIWGQLQALGRAVEKDVKTHFTEAAGWQGTMNTLERWQGFLEALTDVGEALTDVASADAASQIRLLGPFRKGEWWPEEIPNGGEERPYTELMRVVAGRQAPCLEELSRYKGTHLSYRCFL